MTTDPGRPPVASGAADDGMLIGVGGDDRELDRKLDPDVERPSEPSGLPHGLCPFLATPSGAWRAAFPSNEHECTAVEPPVQLALDKQRRLCLVADHETCAAYRAALAGRAPLGPGVGASAATGPAVARARARPWTGRQVARTTPILLERPRPGLALQPAAARSVGQLVLVALVVIAFILIALARLGTPGSPAAAPVLPPAAASAGPGEPPSAQPPERPSARPSDQPASIASNPPS